MDKAGRQTAPWCGRAAGAIIDKTIVELGSSVFSAAFWSHSLVPPCKRPAQSSRFPTLRIAGVGHVHLLTLNPDGYSFFRQGVAGKLMTIVLSGVYLYAAQSNRASALVGRLEAWTAAPASVWESEMIQWQWQKG